MYRISNVFKTIYSYLLEKNTATYVYTSKSCTMTELKITISGHNLCLRKEGSVILQSILAVTKNIRQGILCTHIQFHEFCVS